MHCIGGNDCVTKERKWNKIATRMGFPSNKNLGTLLKAHYERILHPFDIFNKGKGIISTVSFCVYKIPNMGMVLIGLI